MPPLSLSPERCRRPSQDETRFYPAEVPPHLRPILCRSLSSLGAGSSGGPRGRWWGGCAHQLHPPLNARSCCLGGGQVVDRCLKLLAIAGRLIACPLQLLPQAVHQPTERSELSLVSGGVAAGACPSRSRRAVELATDRAADLLVRGVEVVAARPRPACPAAALPLRVEARVGIWPRLESSKQRTGNRRRANVRASMREHFFSSSSWA